MLKKSDTQKRKKGLQNVAVERPIRTYLWITYNYCFALDFAKPRPILIGRIQSAHFLDSRRPTREWKHIIKHQRIEETTSVGIFLLSKRRQLLLSYERIKKQQLYIKRVVRISYISRCCCKILFLDV